MHVLYVSNGLSVHDRRFLARMREWGYRVTFGALAEAPGDLVSACPDGVAWAQWEGAGLVRCPTDGERWAPAFSALLKRERPDVVHAGPVLTGAYLAARAGASPLVAMSWGSDLLVEAERDASARAAARYALQGAARVVVDCTAVRERVRGYGVADETIVQFPWGTDLAHFRPGPDRSGLRASLPADAVVVLSLRSWEPGYGVDVAVEAFARARAVEPRLYLVLLGDGTLRDEVRVHIAEHGLQHAVALMGIVAPEKLPAYYRAADIYLSCAPQDGTSVSLLEAMATALPVVVTDNASNREWVEHGAGRLAPPADAEAFAEHLVALARLSPEELSCLGQRNRVMAVARADWSINSERLRESYEALVSGPAWRS